MQIHNAWSYLNDLQLADPQFSSSGKIDIILGADLLTDNRRRINTRTIEITNRTMHHFRLDRFRFNKF